MEVRGINSLPAGVELEIVKGSAELPYCSTLQSCYGHFLYNDHNNPKNIQPLTNLDKTVSVEYRIAYIALCI